MHMQCISRDCWRERCSQKPIFARVSACAGPVTRARWALAALTRADAQIASERGMTGWSWHSRRSSRVPSTAARYVPR